MNIEKAINTTETSIEIIENQLKDVVKIKNKDIDIFFSGYVASVLELLSDFKCLLINECTISIGLISRSIFELMVDILWIANDDTHTEALALESCLDELRILKSSSEDPENNECEPSIIIKKRIKQVEEVKDSLEKKGIKKVQIKHKCEDIGLQYEYRFMYAILCKEVHNSMDAIEKRHIRQTGSNKYQIIYDQEYAIQLYSSAVAAIFSSICHIIECLDKVCGNSDMQKAKQVDEMADEIFRSEI